MIFVTVGGQKSFDRLVDCVDAWAAERDLGRGEVLAQIGRTDRTPAHIDSVASLGPAEYRQAFLGADLVVAHAGMGTILTALDLGKPLLVMPRRAELGEHRNDHQLATARQLEELVQLAVAWDEAGLRARLADPSSIPAPCPASESRRRLVAFVRDFIGG